MKELELRTEIVPKPLSAVEEASPGSRAATVKRAMIGVNIVVRWSRRYRIEGVVRVSLGM